jgi:hypothetical protein
VNKLAELLGLSKSILISPATITLSLAENVCKITSKSSLNSGIQSRDGGLYIPTTLILQFILDVNLTPMISIILVDLEINCSQ